MVEKDERRFSALMNALADSVGEARDEEILEESSGRRTEDTRKALLAGVDRYRRAVAAGARKSGSGEVWAVEIDLSSLTLVALPRGPLEIGDRVLLGAPVFKGNVQKSDPQGRVDISIIERRADETGAVCLEVELQADPEVGPRDADVRFELTQHDAVIKALDLEMKDGHTRAVIDVEEITDTDGFMARVTITEGEPA